MARANDADRERKAPKSASATSSHTSALVTSGEKAESVIATTGMSRRAAGAGEFGRHRRVGREADGQHRVALGRGRRAARGRAGRCGRSAWRARRACRTHRRNRPRSGKPGARRAGRSCRRWRASRWRGDSSSGRTESRIRSSDTAGGFGEAFEQRHRVNVMSFGLAQPAQALAIIGKTLAQAIAEELLQMREAVIAEALGEAHQGRGLHARMLGDARHRAEGHLLGMREGEGGELLQPFRHGLAPAQQQSSASLRNRPGWHQPPFPSRPPWCRSPIRPIFSQKHGP